MTPQPTALRPMVAVAPVAPAPSPPAIPAVAETEAQRQSEAGGTRARIVVLGASGYTGQEFTRLSWSHPGLELVALASRELAGRPVSDLLPGLDPRTLVLPSVVDLDAVERLFESGLADTVVACLPHGAWQELLDRRPALGALPRTVVDLSSDMRDGASGYVYGLPEGFRRRIASASKVANPGCYPTAATLALLPAQERGWIEGPVMVSAISGVRGACRGPALRTSFVELEGGAAAYKVGDVHPHVAEMERTLAALGTPLSVGFTPQLAPMARGILLTATAPLCRALTPAEVRAAYESRYADEPFVRVLDQESWPETRAVRSSNRCDVAVTTLHGGRTLLAIAALDNLVKGAAGQAIQNLNLMLGWPESWGLPLHGSPW